MPASQGAAERAWAASARMKTPIRNRLEPNTLNTLMHISADSNVLKDVQVRTTAKRRCSPRLIR
eukprot:5121513-Prorocentrum_lima.AAC.1